MKSTPGAKRLALLGLRLAATIQPSSLTEYPRFIRDWRRFRSEGGTAGVVDWYPCLRDRTEQTGFDHQYFYQAVWAARHIKSAGVRLHVDVGSHVLFVAMLTAFTKVTFVDIRPIDATVEDLEMRPGSIVDLPFQSASVESLSCLHVIEHVGLGRYGDPVDPFGPIRAAAELQRVLSPGGRLYLSTPIGMPRVQFNSQRVFGPDEIVEIFERCSLAEFSAVDAAGRFHRSVPVTSTIETFSGNDFGLGMFLFEKKP